jgi:hypothetical protein
VSGAFLDNFLLYGIGIAQILNFVMHSFFGDYAAKTIGWAQSPFQLELAFYSLGLGIAALIAGGKHANLAAMAAVVIGFAVIGYGTAGGHVYQLIARHNHAVNNTGLLLISDFVIPAAGLAILVWNVTARRTSARKRTARTAGASQPAPVAAPSAR